MPSGLLDITKLENGLNHELYEGRFSLEQMGLVHRTGMPICLRTLPQLREYDRTKPISVASFKEAYGDKSHTLTAPNPEAEEDLSTFVTVSQRWGDDFEASMVVNERSTTSPKVNQTKKIELAPEELDDIIRITMLGSVAVDEEASIFLGFDDAYEEQPALLKEIKNGFLNMIGMVNYLNGDESAGTPEIVAKTNQFDTEAVREMTRFFAGTIDNDMLDRISRSPNMVS